MSDNKNSNNPQSLENNSNIHMYQLPNEDVNEARTGKGFFDRDISKIPCFKPSLLYGIGSALAVTLLTSFFPLKGRLKSPDYGIISFLIVSGGYWPICNYNHNVQNKKIKQLMDAQVAEMNRKEQEKLKMAEELKKQENK
ncbi:hypothetical protein DICPUDRAFT_83644 [Dictyostelium purpureum]|uniref:Cytochrome c oxidase assembly protein COX20, mitochondrial n=1 Tax=Dictyostelium purpureum TaxID=5786 RepID=F1A060_DICPU|nr:uncharacterized protein DICPUDRAFT_83644 [Dictyostelium purpureum]EGC30422.1 hypothetical protein DICPUDRAFT_83644 [Dictyostelium purpureum]|eukprot:XP_003293046.1 hypothetical protein DICPUDRAFT_83644 [Dictyostelium purpureum]